MHRSESVYSRVRQGLQCYRLGEHLLFAMYILNSCMLFLYGVGKPQ